MPQCHSCRIQTGDDYLSYGGRHYHLPQDCETFSSAIKAQVDMPRLPESSSNYTQFCWNLANPEAAASSKTVKAAPEQGSKFFLLSCAQTNTPANMDVVYALKTLAEDIGATLMIGALRYKNPNAWHPEGREEDPRRCDHKLLPWLVRESIDLNDNTISVSYTHLTLPTIYSV